MSSALGICGLAGLELVVLVQEHLDGIGIGVEFLAACDAEEAMATPVTWAHKATLGALATQKLNSIAR